MASTVINMTNYTHKAGSLLFHGGDISTPRSHSVKQFHLPKKSAVSASSSPRSRRQQLTVSSVLTATAFSNSPSTSFTFSTEPSTSSSSSSSSSSCSLPLMWREIHGSSDWEGLLDPIHPLLRDEIIRYGKFVTACYEAFDLDPNSRRYLNCKYGKRNMLAGVGLEDSGYEVTKYIYATPDVSIPIGPSCGRWIGYVAVSSDAEVKRLGRRDVVITFRGTVTNPEWVANFMSSLTPARLDPHNPRPEVKVESGFLSLYTADESESRFGISSCREQLLSEVSRLMNKYKGEKLSITLAGHSMGSSLALLLAYDISELGLNNTVNNKNNPVVQEKIPVTVFSFGGPRVGNSAFKERCEELGIKVLRVVNVNDPITKLPGVFLNENFRDLGGRYEFPWSCSCYAHVGVELALDFFNVQNPSCVHDLGTYLSLLHDCSLQKQRDHEDRSNNNTTSADDHHNFLQKARERFLGAPNFNMLPWIHAAGSMVTLIPIISSQWT